MQEEQTNKAPGRALTKEQIARATDPQNKDHGAQRTGGAMIVRSVMLDGKRVFVDRTSYEAVCAGLGVDP